VREKIYTRNILVEQPERVILLGRPRYRWENNVKRDLKDIEWKSVYWIILVLFKEMGGAVLKAIINLYFPKGATKFLTDLNAISFSRTLLHAILF
jgi:hypothetical protein